MSHIPSKLALVVIAAVGFAADASAQGYDPIGDRRFPSYAAAETAGYYLGDLQGPMAGAIIREQLVSAQVGLVSPYVDPGPRRPIARRPVAGPGPAPTPGYVSPMQ